MQGIMGSLLVGTSMQTPQASVSIGATFFLPSSITAATNEMARFVLDVSSMLVKGGEMGARRELHSDSWRSWRYSCVQEVCGQKAHFKV